MGLNPEKMEELKQKYGIDDKAIYDIANALEPDAEAPETPPVGNERTARQPISEAFPTSLQQAMRGDISIAEAIILMDFMDRKDDRRERRYTTTQPTQDTPKLDKLIEEIQNERKEHREQIEKLLLSRRADDAEERAKKAEEELKKKDEADRQRTLVEGAVRGAVSEMDQKYGPQLDRLASRISELPEKQQKSFWDELFTDLESDLRNQFKASIIERLKPAEKPLTRTDEEGKKSIDWEGLLDRGYKLADKYIETQKGKPPKLEVEPINTQPGASPVPLEEPSAKPVEKPPSEVPAVAAQPIPPQDIVGIGPERAKKLSEIGINDARQLAKVSPSHLKDQLGVSKEKAEEIIKQAKDLTEQA